MTSRELGNQHGYQCPTCGAGDELTIAADVHVRARLLLLPDGCDHDGGGDTEWDGDSFVRCGCGWEGIVDNLKIIEVED